MGQLHRDRRMFEDIGYSEGSWQVSGTQLLLSRGIDCPPRQWRLMVSPAGEFIEEHLLWIDRHGFVDRRFNSRREALRVVSAVLAVDPLPDPNNEASA